MFRRRLFIDDGDGNGQLRVGEARSDGAHQYQLPEILHEIGEAGEERGAGEAEHPYTPPSEAVHGIAGPDGDAELRAVNREAEDPEAGFGNVQTPGYVGKRQHQQVDVIRGERPACQRDEDEISQVIARGATLDKER